MHINFGQDHIDIPYYSNMSVDQLGLDSFDYCFNRNLFVHHTPVHYCFNEIGFRTHFVKDFNSNAILVLGDSFTLGLGVNSEDRFSNRLEHQLSHQVLNFSLNGASNDWIARKLKQLLNIFSPTAVIIHYTFSHRRERPNTDWFDDERTECEPFYTSQENFKNWVDNVRSINKYIADIKIIHSFISNWHDCKIDYTFLGPNVIEPLIQIDFARDGFHYGPKTHQNLADKFASILTKK